MMQRYMELFDKGFHHTLADMQPRGGHWWFNFNMHAKPFDAFYKACSYMIDGFKEINEEYEYHDVIWRIEPRIEVREDDGKTSYTPIARWSLGTIKGRE